LLMAMVQCRHTFSQILNEFGFVTFVTNGRDALLSIINICLAGTSCYLIVID
jgi:hypothetical protein